MKNYTITVNGNVYNVTVEEGTTEGVVTSAPVVEKPAAMPAAMPTKKATPAGAVKVNAPMPGKILGVKVSTSQTVKRGDVILVLEAMKMENEVVAPQDGTIASVNVAVGDTVEAGDVLATLN